MTPTLRRHKIAALTAAALFLLAGCNIQGAQSPQSTGGSSPSGSVETDQDRLKSEIDQLRHRLANLEPDAPVTRPLSDIDKQVTLFKATHSVLPVSDVLREGTHLSFIPVTADPEWRRPGYSGIWHSTFLDGKFSDVSRLVELASHRGFVYTGGLAAAQDLLYGLGIVTDPNPNSTRAPRLPLQDTRADHVSILVVYGQVQRMTRLGHQVVVTVVPGTSGYQEVRTELRDFVAQLDGSDRTFLFQFVTPEGYLFDEVVADLSAMN
ncbi:MAG: hypothetical protein IRY98_10855 [Alicyclobacillaceae bacterium]|nr:hypothetical protein [Alicyclobacillaceae bacterium]